MHKIKTFNLPEQVAVHLRRELFQGRWKELLPGRDQLARELEVSPRSVRGALTILEAEGLIEPQGAGRAHKITLDRATEPTSLRIQILVYDETDSREGYMVELVHRLQMAGHQATLSNKNLRKLGMNVSRIAKHIQKCEADAWIVGAGSKEVLQWFAKQPTPAFALFGRSKNIEMAATAPDKGPAEREALDKLFQLGHRSIVRIAPEERRKPVPGAHELMFLETIEKQGVSIGPYNLPDWENSREGLHRCLDSLFASTPPTALFLDGPDLFFATMQHLSRKGYHAPEDVSLICCDPHPVFHWADPEISHISYDSTLWVRRVVRWANNIALRKDDRKRQVYQAKFVEGGTIGPARR